MQLLSRRLARILKFMYCAVYSAPHICREPGIVGLDKIAARCSLGIHATVYRIVAAQASDCWHLCVRLFGGRFRILDPGSTLLQLEVRTEA